MKHCTNCGYELTGDVKFCPHCGHQVVGETGTNIQAINDKKSMNSKQSYDENVHQMRQTTMPKVSQRQSSGSNQSLVIGIIIAVIIVLLGFFFIKTRIVVSREQLADHITKAVQTQDGKMFLHQFSKDDQDLKFSDVGANSIVKDIHKHSRDSLSEVGRLIVNGQSISGTDTKYRFTVESKQVLGLFTSYYLTTRRTPVSVTDYTDGGGPVTIRLKDANNAKVTKQLLKSGFFPGKYNFEVTSGDYSGDYWIRASGDGETIDLELTDD